MSNETNCTKVLQLYASGDKQVSFMKSKWRMCLVLLHELGIDLRCVLLMLKTSKGKLMHDDK